MPLVFLPVATQRALTPLGAIPPGANRSAMNRLPVANRNFVAVGVRVHVLSFQPIAIGCLNCFDLRTNLRR
jgi:hypothetical protein